jgi:hypothetical protein
VNAGTRICFRLGDTDAKRFAGGFSSFEAADLENLHTGEAIARIEQPAFDFNLNTIPLLEVDAEHTAAAVQAVIDYSREAYGTPKEIVEQGLGRREEPAKKQASELPKIDTPTTQPVAAPEVSPAPFVPVEIPRKATLIKKAETQHRYLQALIKKMAESRGYKASVEELTPDGKGRVDVSLERDGNRIAVEISVTTSDEWEAHNVEKCLAAGYDEVIVCSGDLRHLQRIQQQLVRRLKVEQIQKVKILEPPEVVRHLDRQATQEIDTEKVVKGYRVKVEYNASSAAEMNRKQEDVVKTLANSIKRKRSIK